MHTLWPRGEARAEGQGPAPGPPRRAAGPRTDAADFRPDIEGLRGLAILLVVAYHAGLPLPGGFVGVDVFFVLSGFLITGLLVRERERNGRISLPAFYARRARRILPAAAVTIAVTACAMPFFVSPLDLSRFSGDGIASALSFVNVRFAAGDLDYFAPNGALSPFRQFWSLAVEEQFYLLWPALLVAATWRGTPRRVAGAAIAAVLVASLVACVQVGQIAGPLAFYLLPTRAWQLAAGGLLAIASPQVSRMPGRLAAALGWAAVPALAFAALRFDASLSYPGLYALLPTAAAAALVASGDRRGSPGAVLRAGPMRFLGRISYSLYLWHWPFLALPAVLLGAAPSAPLTAALVAGAVVASYLSYRFVEQPFRRPGAHLPAAATLRRAAAVVTGVCVLTVGAGALGTAAAGLGPVPASAPVAAAGTQSTAPGQTAGGADNPAALDDPSLLPDQALLGAPSPSPSRASVAPGTAGASATPVTPSPGPSPTGAATPATPAPRPSFVATVVAPPAGVAATGALPATVRPSLASARDDAEPLLGHGCGDDHGATVPSVCVFGSKDAAHTVVLIGDSHAAQWFGALRVLAEQRGWRLIPLTKAACTLTSERIVDTYTRREYTECAAWRDAVMRIVPSLHPDLVVVALNRWIIPAAGEPATMSGEGRAIGQLLARLPHPVVLISDTPDFGLDVPACLASHRSNLDACRAPAGAAGGYFVPREKTAATVGMATWLDMTRAVCPSLPCSPVVDGTIVMRDSHHMTYTFSRHLAGPLGAALDAAGVGLDPPAPGSSLPPSPATSTSPAAALPQGEPRSRAPAGNLAVDGTARATG